MTRTPSQPESSFGAHDGSDANSRHSGLIGVWLNHREPILFLVVGGWNTLFQYACFSLLYYLLHDSLHADVIVVISYLIASINGFLCFRRFVFRTSDHSFTRYLRYNLIYVPLLLVYMFLLPLALAHQFLSAYAMQALFTVTAIALGYVGNKYFAFRSRSHT